MPKQPQANDDAQAVISEFLTHLAAERHSHNLDIDDKHDV